MLSLPGYWTSESWPARDPKSCCRRAAIGRPSNGGRLLSACTCAGLVFAVVTYVLLLGAGKDPAQFLRSLVPSRQALGEPLGKCAKICIRGHICTHKPRRSAEPSLISCASTEKKCRRTTSDCPLSPYLTNALSLMPGRCINEQHITSEQHSSHAHGSDNPQFSCRLRSAVQGAPVPACARLQPCRCRGSPGSDQRLGVAAVRVLSFFFICIEPKI